MASLFNDDFYEHLHRLEEQSADEDGTWVNVVQDDDPDLLFVQNYAQRKLAIREEQTFKRAVNDCLKKGITGTKEIAKTLHSTSETVTKELEELGLTDLIMSSSYFWNGLILRHLDNGTIMYVRNAQTGADYLHIKAPQSITNALNSIQHHICNHEVFRMPRWKKLNPDFEMDQEELLENEIIQIA